MGKKSSVQSFGRGPSFILTSEPFLGTFPFRYTERLEMTFNMTLAEKSTDVWNDDVFSFIVMLLFIGKSADRFIIVTALIANNSKKNLDGKRRRKFWRNGSEIEVRVHFHECGVCYAKGRRRHPRFLRIKCGVRRIQSKGSSHFSITGMLKRAHRPNKPWRLWPDLTSDLPKAKKGKKKGKRKEKKRKEETLHGV